MPNTKIELMQKKVADSLERSGEFSKIEVAYKLGDKFLDYLYHNHLYARKNTENLDLDRDEKPDFLIMFHTNNYPNDNLFKKIKQLSEAEYQVGNILWKGESFFKWARAPFRPAIKDYEMEEEKAMIDLNLNERTLETLTKNNVVYFKPSTERLQIIKFKGNIMSDYSHKGEGFFEQERNLVRTRKNEVYRDFNVNTDKMTFIGYANRDLRLALPVRAPSIVSRQLWQLNLAIKKRNANQVTNLIEKLNPILESTNQADPNVAEFVQLINKSKDYKLI